MDAKAVSLLRQIISHARAAPADEERWKFVVTSVSELFEARGTVLFTPEPGPCTVPLGISDRDITAGIPDYFANWAHDDAWLKAVDRQSFFQRAGESKFTQEFLPESELTGTAFFNDWARHFHAERSLALKITDSNDPVAPTLHLSIFRRLSDSPFEQSDKDVLESLWPELNAAAQAYYTLQPLRAQSAVETVLDELPTATWVLRPDAQIAFANARARESSRRQFWSQERAGRLTRLGHLDAQTIVHQIAATNAATTSATTSATTAATTTADPLEAARPRATIAAVNHEGRLQRGILHWVPLRESPAYAAAWPGATAIVMLQLPPPADTDALWLEHLARHFRLTPSQSAVLLALTAGQTVDDIAKARHVSTGTIRSHLHELMDKTGMHRQADLVRLALGR